jgi:lipoprotein NlpI
MMVTYYQQYIDTVTVKGEAEMTKNKPKFIEAYNNMAATFANTDKAKAKELFNKTLALDPANNYATESLKVLK